MRASYTSWRKLRSAAALACLAASVWCSQRLAARPTEWKPFRLPAGSYTLETDQISPDGSLLVSIDLAGRPQLIDRYRRQILARCPGSDTVTTSVQFSPDASRFATTAIDGALRFWEHRDGECLRIREIPGTFPLYDANYSPDGKSLVTVGEAPAATLWDVAQGVPRQKLETQEAALVSASFSPALPQILTLSHDGAIGVWSTTDGSLLAQLQGGAPVEWARFDSTGRAVLLGSPDGSAAGFRALPGWRAASFRDPELWLLLLTSLVFLFELARRLRPRAITTGVRSTTLRSREMA